MLSGRAGRGNGSFRRPRAFTLSNGALVSGASNDRGQPLTCHLFRVDQIPPGVPKNAAVALDSFIFYHYICAINRTVPDAPVTTTVAGLSDRHLVQRLKELTAVEHQLEVVVIDHLRELDRRRLYLPLGCSSLFDYATRELGYSEAAAWRRIKAMRLCGEVEGARERMRDGSLTLNSAALLQNAFDRQERKQSGGGRGAQVSVRPAVAPNGSAPDGGASSRALGAPAQIGERAEEPHAAPVLDSSARQALVEQAAGKSTRQVEKLLAGVDPELTAPADRIRPLGADRWELKAVIDDDCRRGLEQLKGLLSHVDPHLTLGQLVGRVVREAIERHDPARPPRGRRTGSRAVSSGADETSAPKDAARSDAAGVRRNAAPTVGVGETSAEGTGFNGAGATDRRAGGRDDFARRRRRTPCTGAPQTGKAARHGRPIRHFGAEGGMRPASRAPGAAQRPRHSATSSSAPLLCHAVVVALLLEAPEVGLVDAGGRLYGRPRNVSAQESLDGLHLPAQFAFLAPFADAFPAPPFDHSFHVVHQHSSTARHVAA